MRIVGAADEGHLRGICARRVAYEADKLERELIEQAKELITRYPEVAIVVLECTNMPPYANAIQRAIQLPVYDVYTMGKWFYEGLARLSPATWK